MSLGFGNGVLAPAGPVAGSALGTVAVLDISEGMVNWGARVLFWDIAPETLQQAQIALVMNFVSRGLPTGNDAAAFTCEGLLYTLSQL
jgi:hypothetical protein